MVQYLKLYPFILIMLSFQPNQPPPIIHNSRDAALLQNFLWGLSKNLKKNVFRRLVYEVPYSNLRLLFVVTNLQGTGFGAIPGIISGHFNYAQFSTQPATSNHSKFEGWSMRRVGREWISRFYL